VRIRCESPASESGDTVGGTVEEEVEVSDKNATSAKAKMSDHGRGE